MNRLGVGFIGSGFITRFHIQSWTGVRDADVLGVYSPNPRHAEEVAAFARELRVGSARAFTSIEEMVSAPEIDCIWICGPNHMRLDNTNMRERCKGVWARKLITGKGPQRILHAQ